MSETRGHPHKYSHEQDRKLMNAVPSSFKRANTSNNCSKGGSLTSALDEKWFGMMSFHRNALERRVMTRARFNSHPGMVLWETAVFLHHPVNGRKVAIMALIFTIVVVLALLCTTLAIVVRWRQEDDQELVYLRSVLDELSSSRDIHDDPPDQNIAPVPYFEGGTNPPTMSSIPSMAPSVVSVSNSPSAAESVVPTDNETPQPTAAPVVDTPSPVEQVTPSPMVDTLSPGSRNAFARGSTRHTSTSRRNRRLHGSIHSIPHLYRRK